MHTGCCSSPCGSLTQLAEWLVSWHRLLASRARAVLLHPHAASPSPFPPALPLPVVQGCLLSTASADDVYRVSCTWG